MNINRCTSLSSAEALQERWENVKERMGKLPMCFLYPLPFSASALPAYMAKGKCGGGGWGYSPGVFFLPPHHPLHCRSTWSRESVEEGMEAFHPCFLPLPSQSPHSKPTKSRQHKKCPWGGERMCMVVL